MFFSSSNNRNFHKLGIMLVDAIINGFLVNRNILVQLLCIVPSAERSEHDRGYPGAGEGT